MPVLLWPREAHCCFFRVKRAGPPLPDVPKSKIGKVDAFSHLKELFTSAPVLHSPDPSRQFIIEVDASDSGEGAILSEVFWWQDSSLCLSAAERNYDVGDSELLALKLALEEWRHWLEGAKDPFIVWTDHKNLEYFRSAKRLNPRQARWALFFSRFNFTLFYRPGTKNTNTSALSRLHETPEEGQTEGGRDYILPLSVLQAVTRLGLERKIKEAHQQHPVPENCPNDPLCPGSPSLRGMEEKFRVLVLTCRCHYMLYRVMAIFRIDSLGTMNVLSKGKKKNNRQNSVLALRFEE